MSIIKRLRRSVLAFFVDPYAEARKPLPALMPTGATPADILQEIISETRPTGQMHPLEIVKEWKRGCTDTQVFGYPASRCDQCSANMVTALTISTLAVSRKLHHLQRCMDQ